MSDSPPSSADAVVDPAAARSRTVMLIAAAIGLVALVFVVVLATANPDQNLTGPSPLIGTEAPEVVAVDLDGEQFSLAELEGQWVVVNFFATWCGPCEREHPELVAFDDEYGQTSARVVSVVFQDEPADVRDFFDRNGGDWPIINDDQGIAIEFGVTGVPESFIISPDGFVEARLISGVTKQGLEAVISQASQSLNPLRG